MKLYRGLGGAAGGGSVLAAVSLEASQIPASTTTNVFFIFPGVTLSAGVYSVQLSSITGTTGAKQYSYKSGASSITTNGVALEGMYWVQENNNSQGQATTNFAASYVLADYGLGKTNYSFGNYRIGDALSTQIGLTNRAIYTTNNATEKLYATGVVSGSVTLSGLSTNLLAVNQSTLFSLSLNSNNVGVNSGYVTLNFGSYTNGTTSARAGSNPTNIGSKIVMVNGVGYRLAAVGVGNTNINFGNYRIGDSLSTLLGLTNTAANDGFSEKLGVSTNSISGILTVSGGPGGLLAAQSNANITVGMSSASVGTNSGTFTLGFGSDGVGTSGFSASNLGSKIITVNGVGYRLATVGLNKTEVDFGNYHLGDALNGAIGLTNMAVNDGFSEKLGVSTNSISGNLTVSGGPGGLLAAQFSANFTVGMNSASVGTNNGTFTLGFGSDGTGTSGFTASNLGSQIITARGIGYQLASATLATTNINLGRIHEGGTFGSQYLSLSNSAPASSFTETLSASFGTATGGATGNGSVTNIGAGGTDTASLLIGLSDNSAGDKSGAIQMNLASREVNGSGLGTTLLANQTITVSGFAYTGRAHWNTNGNGGWSSFENWDAMGGTPGLDGALSTNDTAMFAAGPTSSTTLVSLNGASPVLSSIVFSNTASSYTVAPGSGGSLTLGTVGHAGAISVSGGSHTISATMALAQHTTINVAQTNAGLIVSGSISGDNKNLTKTGAGWVNLSTTNTYSGSTVVGEGRLSVNGSLASPDVTVLNGATLGGTGTISGLTTIESGGFLSPGNSPGVLTFTNGVVFDSGSHLLWQLIDNTSDPLLRGSAYDGIDLLGGNAHINSNAVLDLDFASAGSTVNWTDSFWNTNQHWTLIKNVGLGEILGTFTNINVGTDSSSRLLTSVHPGSFFTVFADGNDNLGLSYNAVFLPEPSACTLVAVGASVLSLIHRRRHGARSMGYRPPAPETIQSWPPGYGATPLRLSAKTENAETLT